jgi:hypothetical protein
MFPGIEAAPKSSLIEGIALAFPSPPPSGGGAIPVDEPVSYLSYPPLAAPSSAKLHKKNLKNRTHALVIVFLFLFRRRATKPTHASRKLKI